MQTCTRSTDRPLAPSFPTPLRVLPFPEALVAACDLPVKPHLICYSLFRRFLLPFQIKRDSPHTAAYVLCSRLFSRHILSCLPNISIS